MRTGLGIDDASGDTGDYSDLWKYSASTNQWTWVGGPNKANQLDVYGSQGTAAFTNTPGALERGVTWTDSSGNVWLFGGLGYDSVGTVGNNGNLNDLWKYGWFQYILVRSYPAVEPDNFAFSHKGFLACRL